MPNRSGIRALWVCGFTSPIASLFQTTALNTDSSTLSTPGPQQSPAPSEQVPFTREAPSHIPPSHGNRAPSTHIEEGMETRILQVVSTGQAKEDSESYEDHIKKTLSSVSSPPKEDETRQSRLLYLNPTYPHPPLSLSLPLSLPHKVQTASPLSTFHSCSQSQSQPASLLCLWTMIQYLTRTVKISSPRMLAVWLRVYSPSEVHLCIEGTLRAERNSQWG